MITYNFKDEFSPKYNISYMDYRKHKEELLNHLKEYFDYKLLNTIPLKIIIYKELKPYEQFNTDREIETELKKEDYECYVADHLTNQYSFTSKSKMSRQAIHDFSKRLYNHTNYIGITKRYVSDAMEKYGEHTQEKYWVFSKTYKQPSQQVLQEWLNVLTNANISHKKAIVDLDVDNFTVNYYDAALQKFRNKHNDVLISVYQWRRKQNYIDYTQRVVLNKEYITLPFTVQDIIEYSKWLNSNTFSCNNNYDDEEEYELYVAKED